MTIRVSELDPKKGWAADAYILTDDERREAILAPLRERLAKTQQRIAFVEQLTGDALYQEWLTAWGRRR